MRAVAALVVAALPVAEELVVAVWAAEATRGRSPSVGEEVAREKVATAAVGMGEVETEGLVVGWEAVAVFEAAAKMVAKAAAAAASEAVVGREEAMEKAVKAMAVGLEAVETA